MAAVAVAGGIALLLAHGDAMWDTLARMIARIIAQITELISENTPAEVFIPLMVVLPLAGMPLTVFLLVLGIKFGVGPGLLLLEIILPVHILIAYFLAIGVRAPIEKYLIRRKNFQIPEVPAHKALIFSFLVVTFPVFPYVVKLYLLPLAGVRFRYCFWVNWVVQGTMCIPFVLLGRSAAEMNLTMLTATLIAIVVMVFSLRWAGKKYTALQKEKIS
jgi:uncharacterized membrane protein YdjX (TVP38/TMEM64 family)